MKRAIHTVIIHCSDTKNGRFTTLREIDMWHAVRCAEGDLSLREEGALWFSSKFPYIAYHAFIDTGGVRHMGRHPDEVGSHAGGHNQHSLGVCMAGTDQFTLAQWTELRRYVAECREEYGQDTRVIGHNEVSSKTCPGFSVADWLLHDLQPLEGHVL